ncbi:unnamed protein product [Nippostrongylus brasiliensis]|uniref:SWIM-type domain-containing protein n=1 Tax=Nippostrongylus brasiliensis TaxID=27835 RepID=A0A0N4Y8V9_NIPBR|nr:unnamed protein product [Nippostrongylus brasiliensis]
MEPALLSLDKKSTDYVASLLQGGFGARQIVEKINNHCKKCKACPYAFTCDCEHDAMSRVSCAHIHAELIHGSGGLLGDGLQADGYLPIGGKPLRYGGGRHPE